MLRTYDLCTSEYAFKDTQNDEDISSGNAVFNVHQNEDGNEKTFILRVARLTFAKFALKAYEVKAENFLARQSKSFSTTKTIFISSLPKFEVQK